VGLPREERSVFESDDDDDDDGDDHEGGGNQGEVGKSGVGMGKKGMEEEGEVTEDDFQTPREESTPGVGYGAFGEELKPDEEEGEEGDDGGDEDDPKRKKAARTLSLSQLTLGKGQRTRI
jgi:hypothetical protein